MFTPIGNQVVSSSIGTHKDPFIITGSGESRQPLPVVFPNCRKRFLIARQNFWVPNEIVMNEDIIQYNNGELSDNEMHIFKCNISYLTVGDNLIPDNIVNTILPRVKASELRQLLRWIIAEEANHIESYLYILESFGLDESAQGAIFDLYRSIPAIREKVNWNIEYSSRIDNTLPSEDPEYYKALIENLVAYYIFEYVFFPAGFSQIFGFARIGKLKNTAQQYSYILRDETLHGGNALFMIRHLLHKEFPEKVLDNAMIHNLRSIIDSGVQLELLHNKDVFGEGIEGYSWGDYVLYVKYLADKACDNLGLPTLYGVKINPIPWINAYQLQTETNFFEGRVREYKTGSNLVFNRI